MTMNPVVHFEMPAKDTKRMSDFYSKAFGWEPKQMGAEFGGYVVVTTTPAGDDGFPKERGQINGGFYQRSEDPISHTPSIVISVPDIHAHMKKVAEAGGKVLGGQKPGEPDNIPGIGLFRSFIDTEGNRVSMLQPMGM